MIKFNHKQNKISVQPIEEDIEELFEKAKHIKPKHKLTAEQMDELIENEILGKSYSPRKEP